MYMYTHFARLALALHTHWAYGLRMYTLVDLQLLYMNILADLQLSFLYDIDRCRIIRFHASFPRPHEVLSPCSVQTDAN